MSLARWATSWRILKYKTTIGAGGEAQGGGGRLVQGLPSGEEGAGDQDQQHGWGGKGGALYQHE